MERFGLCFAARDHMKSRKAKRFLNRLVEVFDAGDGPSIPRIEASLKNDANVSQRHQHRMDSKKWALTHQADSQKYTKQLIQDPAKAKGEVKQQVMDAEEKMLAMYESLAKQINQMQLMMKRHRQSKPEPTPTDHDTRSGRRN